MRLISLSRDDDALITVIYNNYTLNCILTFLAHFYVLLIRISLYVRVYVYFLIVVLMTKVKYTGPYTPP